MGETKTSKTSKTLNAMGWLINTNNSIIKYTLVFYQPANPRATSRDAL